MRVRQGEVSSERAVLDALLAAPAHGLSRSELQEAAGTSAATLVSLLRQASGATDRPGRLLRLVDTLDDGRLQRYRLKPNACYALAIELGRDRLRVAIGDTRGRVVRRANGELWEKTDVSIAPSTRPYEALELVADLAAEIVNDFEATEETGRFAGIGVAVPSTIDTDTGAFRQGWGRDAWEGLRVGREIESRLLARNLTCPVTISKDANFGARAFARSKDAANIDDFVFVKWAHGLTAGISLGGKLQEGARGSAGGFSHSQIVVVRDSGSQESRPSRVWNPDDAWRCGLCGKQDCLEAMISTDRLRREVALLRGLPGEHADQWPTFAAITEAALADRASAEAEVLRAAAKRLGNALGAVANMLNPEVIAVGGEVGTAHAPLLSDRVREGIRDVANGPAFRDVQVVFTDLGAIEGAIASVITGDRLASLLTLAGPRERDNRVPAGAASR